MTVMTTTKKPRSYDYNTLFSKKPKELTQITDNETSDKDLATIMHSINAHSSKVHSVHWSCDGTSLGSGSVDRTGSIMKLLPGSNKITKVASCKGHTSHVDQLVFAPNHPDIFATAAHDKTVRFWDMRLSQTNKQNEATGDNISLGKMASDKMNETDVDAFEAKYKIDTKGENINLSWSPDGKYVCVGNKDDLLSFIDCTRNPPSIIKSHQFKTEVNEFAWNTTSQIFVITTGGGKIQSYNFNDFIKSSLDIDMDDFLLDTFDAHSSNCICLKFDSKGDHFAVGSNDTLVSLWDAKDFIPVRTYSELHWPVRTLSFSHDSKLIAAASEDHFVDISLVEPTPGSSEWNEHSQDFSNKMDIYSTHDYGNEFDLYHNGGYNLSNNVVSLKSKSDKKQQQQTSSSVYKIQTGLPTFTVAWHPKRCLLAYACEEKDSSSSRSKDKESNVGNIRFFGVEEKSIA